MGSFLSIALRYPTLLLSLSLSSHLFSFCLDTDSHRALLLAYLNVYLPNEGGIYDNEYMMYE